MLAPSPAPGHPAHPAQSTHSPSAPTVTTTAATSATAATAAPACSTAMALLRVLAFDHEGRLVQFDTWLDNLQLYLLSDSKDSVSLFDLASSAATAPPATADSSTRSQWLTRDAAARLAIPNHLPFTECAHFGQHRTAQALYDAVVARYSSPATAALGRLLLPYLFPELSAFSTVEDLVSHLRASDTRYCAAVPSEFLHRNPPPMYIALYFIFNRLPDSLRPVRDHLLSLYPTSLTIDLLEQHLIAAETRAVAVGAARGTPRPPYFEGCSPSPLAPSYAFAAAAGVSVPEDVRAASASAKCRSSKGKGGRGGGGGSGGGGGGSGSGGGGSSGGGGGGGTVGGSGGSGSGGGGSGGSGGSGGGGTGGGGTGAQRVSSGGGHRLQQQRRSETPSPQQLREWFQRGASRGSCPYVIRTGDRAGQTCGRLHTQNRCFSRLNDAWRAEFGDDVELPHRADVLKSRIPIFDLDFDAILSAMYALSFSTEGDCYRCVSPDPGIAAAALGASESGTLPDYPTALVAETASTSPPSIGGECALGTDVLEDRLEDFGSLAAAVPRFASMVLAPEGDPDAPDIPTPRYYAEAITGPYSSQWQAAMDAEIASWKSTGTYVNEVPPHGANKVDGMWIFRVKRPPGSPTAFKVRYVARGFSQQQGVDYFHTFSPTPKMTTLRVLLHVVAQRDYELHSLDFSTAFLQGSLNKEIWLCRPAGFTKSFPAGTQWSLRQPVHGLRQAPCEWHDTLRTTLTDLGFAPATADPSLFLRTDTSLPPFYILLSWLADHPGRLSPQVLSELFPKQCVTSSVEAAALGASESAVALGASESAAALGAIESAAALGARASPATGPSSAKALHTFTLDSGALRCFFRDCTTLTPLAVLVPVSLADPTGGPVVARASTVLPCAVVPYESLSGLHLPTFSTKLVSNAAIQDVWVDTFIPGGQRVAICTCSRTGRHLATFIRQPGSSLYTLTTTSLQVAEAGQVAASSQVSSSGLLLASCSCRVLSHQTLLWHHRLGHPSLPRLRSMHSRLLRYFLLVVDDYRRYTTVFPLLRKADVSGVLIPWIRATRRQLRERFNQDFPILRLHSDRGGEFSSDLLAEFCRDESIVQSFTLPASPQQNGIAECRIGLIMEIALSN
ncbi:unnamed protein product [Closterium sp. NIES-54]